MRAEQRTRPASTSQYGRKLFLPLRSFRDRLGRSRRAQARAGATRHDLRAARREPQLPQRLNEQVDPVSYAPSLAKEIEKEYGKTAVEGLQKIGFKFEDEPSA